QKTESLANRLVVEAQQLEHAALQVGLVDAQASARELVAVAYRVVRVGADFVRPRVDELEVLLEWTRERMMPVREASVVVLFEEVHRVDPQELPFPLPDQPAPAGHLLADQADHGFGPALAVGHHQDQVSLASPGALADRSP